MGFSWHHFTFETVPLIKKLWDYDQKSPPPPRHVFIDVGGNIGDSVSAFLSVGVPGVSKAGADFDSIYVFEPNPEFAHAYERYREKSFSFEYIQAAATAKDGFMTFEGTGLGGSVVKTSSSSQQDAIPTVDFSSWLQRTVTLRDFVVCKIDTEGAEFEIVPRMVADGTLCLCDRLSIEWHSWLGSRSPLDPLVRNYLDPNATTDHFDEGCVANNCFCSIPHLEKELPYFFCGLPYTTKWLRQSCVDGDTPPLEHHESWKGWEHVGTPDAFMFLKD